MQGGGAQGVRAYHERLIISAVREAGPLSKADLARVTGLSRQAASVIVNDLLASGLLRKEAKVRGGVGQPQTPIALNPDGAYALGVKIGRRSAEAVLVNFRGEIIAERIAYYDAPDPAATMPVLIEHATSLRATLPADAQARVVGLGLAMPGDFHEWAAEMGLPEGALDGWRDMAPGAALAAATGLDVDIINDATAACAAELLAGSALDCRSALYVFVGAFIGGGLVIDGRLHQGDRLNAGALGPMPMGAADDAPPQQLLHCASFIQLEHVLRANGVEPISAIDRGDAPEAEPFFDDWLRRAAPAIAQAVVAATSIIDIERCVIDGVANPRWRARMVDAVAREHLRFNHAGLSPLRFEAGGVGPGARVLGAALTRLETRFSADARILTRGSQAA